MELLLGALAAVIATIPFARLRRLGAAIGWVAGRLVRVRRRHVIASLRAAGIDHAERTADGMYRALGVSALELLWLAGHKKQAAGSVALLSPSAAKALRTAQERGRGVVVAGSHTGNWELAACAMAERSEFLVVAKRLSVGAIDRFARRVRRARGILLVEPKGALATGQKALARGAIVTLLVDQVPDEGVRALDVRFLGQRARADRAAAVLAWRTGAPLVVTAARRADDGTHVIDVLATLEAPEGVDRGWVNDATRSVTHVLEGFVRAHPTEWLWLHRRWRQPEHGRVAGPMAEPSRIR